jgi:hypothetical protein
MAKAKGTTLVVKKKKKTGKAKKHPNKKSSVKKYKGQGR